MFAVFQSGGKQHRVSESDIVVELLEGEPGAEVTFDRVLMVADGDNVDIGTPYVNDGKVTAEVGRSIDRPGKKVRIIEVQATQRLFEAPGPQTLVHKIKVPTQWRWQF